MPAVDGLADVAHVEPLRITVEYRRHVERRTPAPLMRMSNELAPGVRRVLRAPVAELIQTTERVTRWSGITVDTQLVGKQQLRHGKPALIVSGPPRTVAEALALTRFRKLLHVFTMVATAYTADSASTSGTGITATGLAARYGVVAVDPQVIPLGAHLFIPGYGTAIAADTGGSIIGNRIDLCMDSLRDALNFGRQPVQVYVISQ